MAKKRKRGARKSISGFSTRTRLIFSVVCLSIIVAGLIAYAISSYNAFLASIPPSTTSITTETATSPTTPVVTPASTSEVPSLTPASSGSTVTSYQSTNWAGYLTTGVNISSITGNWVAPNPIATSTSVESGDGTWIGIGGVTSSDLIQIGTENTISASGVLTTAAFYELVPDDAVSITSLTVSPGDTLSASITQVSDNQWTVSIADMTTRQSFSTNVTYSSSRSSAEWIQEDPSYHENGLVLLDNFGTVQFSNATVTVNGATLTAGTSGASTITMTGQGGAAGHTGKPSDLNGSSFVVQYL